MTGAEQKRLLEIRRLLMRMGWKMRVVEDGWTAEKHGFLAHHATAEGLLVTCKELSPPKPPKVKKPKRKGVLGRRPRVDLDESLFRCILTDHHKLPCAALVWARTDDMRDHLSQYHLHLTTVASMSDLAVASCFEKPADVPDDNTGDDDDGF